MIGEEESSGHVVDLESARARWHTSQSALPLKLVYDPDRKQGEKKRQGFTMHHTFTSTHSNLHSQLKWSVSERPGMRVFLV